MTYYLDSPPEPTCAGPRCDLYDSCYDCLKEQQEVTEAMIDNQIDIERGK